MDLLQWFEKGLTAEEYIAGMEKNKDEMTNIYNQFTLTDEEQDQIVKVKENDWKADRLNRRLVWRCDVKHPDSSQNCRGSKDRCSICFTGSKS